MKKRNVKLTRKKLTKEFVDLYTYSLPHWRLEEICQRYLKKKLNKLSEEDFIKKLEEEYFGDRTVCAVAQWDLFNKYIEQKNK